MSSFGHLTQLVVWKHSTSRHYNGHWMNPLSSSPTFSWRRRRRTRPWELRIRRMHVMHVHFSHLIPGKIFLHCRGTIIIQLMTSCPSIKLISVSRWRNATRRQMTMTRKATPDELRMITLWLVLFTEINLRDTVSYSQRGLLFSETNKETGQGLCE